VTDFQSSRLSEIRRVPRCVFREHLTFKRKAVAYIRRQTANPSLIEKVVEQGPAYAAEIERAAFKPRLTLDLASLAVWKNLQSERKARLGALLGDASKAKVNLSKGIFSNATTSDQIGSVVLSEIRQFEPGQIYILNSNDINKIGRKRYAELFVSAQDSYVAVWDFDNHHALTTSFLIASFSDLYIPCHGHNLAQISQFTEAIAAPVRAGVIQWAREFLREHQGLILHGERNPNPLGRHVIYPKFKTRNWMIERLSGHFPDVGAVKADYHAKSDLERLTEWSAHMSHWIIPTFNDLPIRIYDALITGGIPILPRALLHNAELVNIRDSAFFFDERDLETPARITDAANDFFVKQGREGIEIRLRQAMEEEHVDARVATIVAVIRNDLTS